MSEGGELAPFIVFEGTEGSGKSTQAALLADALRRDGAAVVSTREPGGTAIGEQIRAILLDPGNCAILAETEALLYAAARAQHVREVVRPSLEAGSVVVSDRFLDSSLAYQGAGRGLSRERLLAIQELATGGLRPDLRVLLDLPVGLGLERRMATAEVNRLDAEDRLFHERVRRAFLEMAAADPGGWAVIDGSGDKGDVARSVAAEVRARLQSRLTRRRPRVGER